MSRRKSGLETLKQVPDGAVELHSMHGPRRVVVS